MTKSKVKAKVKAKVLKSSKIMEAWTEAVKVRADYRCEYCGRSKPYVLNAHHIFGRRHSTVKYDLDNGICLCYNCHNEAHNNPEFIKWIVNYIGKDRYDRIKAKHDQVKKWTEIEKREVYQSLKKFVEQK